jgi:nucleoid-associated protein YgaU
VQLGLENKKKTMWAAVLGGLALLLVAYQFLPMLTESSSPGSNAQAAAPAPPRATATKGGKAAKKLSTENLDPTLKLDLLASTEQTLYQGSGRNIFVSQAEEIPTPLKNGMANQRKAEETHIYQPPPAPIQIPIPLKFSGFASKPGEPKKIFLTQGEDVWVAGEGEIVNRRYKVVRISPTFVEIQDVVNSGEPQRIPLTQG